MGPNDLLGRFVWHELLTTEPDAAQEFYRDVVGWSVEAVDVQGMPYPMWKAGERALGGLMQLPPEAVEQGAQPHWLGHIGTPDVEATARRVEQGGGQVLKHMEIDAVGRLAIVTDPHGAVFSIYTPESEMPQAEGWPEPGDVSWNELAAGDLEEAFEFYSSLFGWKKGDAHDMGEMGIYQIYLRAGQPLGGMFSKPPEMPAMWIFYALVEDINQQTAKIKEGGGTVLNGPMKVPGEDWIVQFVDPQGALFALHQRAES